MTPSCRVCGRTLADPVSQARGVGPVCDKATRRRTAPRLSTPHTEPDIHPDQIELPLPPMQSALTWST